MGGQDAGPVPDQSPPGWRWDGRRWVSARSSPSLWARLLVPMPVWLRVLALVWLVVLGVWVPVAVGMARPTPQPALSTSGLVTVEALAGLGVAFTVGWGALLGRRRAWLQLVASVALGAGLLLFWYVYAMIVLAGPADATADNAAGAGVAILAVPSAVVIALLLMLGCGVGEGARLVARLLREGGQSDPN
ncbi:MAG: hypothetical protein JWN00_1542 [Actinomycetia bacterium]|nr:hypothetical protein [Actinomycetes bacterium]